MSPIAFTRVCKSSRVSVLTGRCCVGAGFVDGEEDEEEDAGAEAAALFSSTTEEDDERVDDEEEAFRSDAVAALSETLLTTASGSSMPVGRERASATTFAFPQVS